MLETIRQTADGARILKDWLGDGGVPVSSELAERRAMTCTCCNQNVAPRWWEKVLNRIALAIREQIEVKTKLGIKTSLDDELHMCKACGCCLQLKAVSPIKHIADHTRPETLAKMPEFCWIRREIKELE